MLAALLCMASAVAVGAYVSKKISKPIIDLSFAAERLAIGDLDVIVNTDLKDEIGVLVDSFSRMTENMRKQAETAENIALGNLDVHVEPRSEDDRLGLSIQSVISTLKALTNEINGMTEAAQSGDFAFRGDADSYSGGYYHIVKGFNDTVEAITAPMTVTAEYLRRISRGEIPQEISEEYHGDFNEIKDSLNTCIRAVNSMIMDVNILTEAAIEGRLSVRAAAENHGGDLKKSSQVLMQL